MKRSCFSLAAYIAATIALILMVSCTTVSESPLAKPGASIQVLDRNAVKSYFGPNPSTDPFIEPAGLLQGQKSEFVVIELRLNLVAKARVTLFATAETPDGATVAQLLDAEGMLAYWAGWPGLGGHTGEESRGKKIDDYCIPSPSFIASKGASRYIAVLVGKNPLPRPATVRIHALVEGLEPQLLVLPLAELPAKK
jgi:hypothetical protein